jgi:hypothetical protein
MALTRLDKFLIIVVHYRLIEFGANVYVFQRIDVASVTTDIYFFIFNSLASVPYFGIVCSNGNRRTDNKLRTDIELFLWLSYTIFFIGTIAFTYSCISDTVITPQFQEPGYVTFNIIKLICKISILIAWLCIICKELYIEEEERPLIKKTDS